MAIELRIDDMLAERGQTAYWLAKETGMSHGGVWKLRHGQTKALNLEYLDKLCAALECAPGDLLVRVLKKGSKK